MPTYGKVGHPGGYYMAPHLAAANGCIEMQSEPPSCDAIARADGTWAAPTVDPKTRLAEIDLESSRPIRAILAGTATQEDRDKLASLEAEAIQLRASIKE